MFTRAPSPNLTPTVLTPSPAVRVAGVAGLNGPAHPLVSGVVPIGTRNWHGKVPSPSTSVADCVIPLEVPGAPPMSGSVASRLSVTFRLFVATAPSLICTVPLGGVASMRVVPVASKVLKSPTMHVGHRLAGGDADRVLRAVGEEEGERDEAVGPAEKVWGLPPASWVMVTVCLSLPGPGDRKSVGFQTRVPVTAVARPLLRLGERRRG